MNHVGKLVVNGEEVLGYISSFENEEENKDFWFWKFVSLDDDNDIWNGMIYTDEVDFVTDFEVSIGGNSRP